MPLNGNLLGGMAQGFGQGQRIMQGVQDQQLQREMMDLRLEQFKQEQEEAKVKRSKLERALKAQDRLQQVLQGSPMDTAQRGTSGASPAGSALANQNPQRQIDPTQLMQAMAGVDPEAAIKFGASQRMLQTPRAQQETLESTLRANKTRLDMLKAQQSMLKGEQDLILGEQRFKLGGLDFKKKEQDIQKSLIDQRLALANIDKTRQGYRIAVKKEANEGNVAAMLAQGAETGQPHKVKAFALWSGGEKEAAIQTYFSPLAGMSKLEIMQGAMTGNEDMINAVMADSELSEKGGFSITTDANGRITGVATGSQTLPTGQAAQIFKDMKTIFDVEGALSLAESEMVAAEERGDANTVGIIGSAIRSFGGMFNMIGNWTASGPEAQKVLNAARDDKLSASVRMDSALTILAAMATRSVLSETGVLTNQDVARGRRLSGQGMFSGPRVVNERLKFLRKSLGERAKALTKQRDFAMSMAPEKSRPFIEQAFKRAGKGGGAKDTTPANQTLEDLDAQIEAEMKAIRELEGQR